MNQIKPWAVVLSLYLAQQLTCLSQTRRQVCVHEKQLISHWIHLFLQQKALYLNWLGAAKWSRHDSCGYGDMAVTLGAFSGLQSCCTTFGLRDFSKGDISNPWGAVSYRCVANGVCTGPYIQTWVIWTAKFNTCCWIHRIITSEA